MAKCILILLMIGLLSYTPIFGQTTANDWCEKARNETNPTLKENYANQALKLDSTSAWAYLLRGLARRSQKRPLEAIADFSHAIRLDPSYSHAYSHRADTYYSVNDIKGTLRDMDSLVAFEPNNASLWNERGNLKWELGLYQEANLDFIRSIELKPSAKAYNNLGQFKYKAGLIRESITDFTQAIGLDSTYANGYLNRGLARLTLKLPYDAITDFTKLIQLKPTFASAYMNRGNARVAIGAAQDALADYNEAIRLSPGEADNYFNRAIAEVHLNKLPEALADYNESFRLDTTAIHRRQVCLNRGMVFSRLSEHQKALADYQCSIANGGNSSTHYNNRGNAYRELGRYSEAITDYDEAIRLYPTQADTYLNKGMALTRMKRYKEAMECFAKGEKLNPSLTYHKADKEKAEKAP